MPSGEKKAFFCYILCTLIPPPHNIQATSKAPRMCTYGRVGKPAAYFVLARRNSVRGIPMRQNPPTFSLLVHLHERAGGGGEGETGAGKTHPVREREK